MAVGVQWFFRSKVASHRCRWWSSVILVIAFAPIVALYLIWLPLTCMGKIKAADLPENEEFGRPTTAARPTEAAKAPKTINPMSDRGNGEDEA